MAIARLPSDYDEVYYAHSAWLIAQGDRPFDDFLAVHTPFLWYAVSSLLLWLPDSPGMLLPLRISTGIGTLAWLAALIANFQCTKINLSLRWMLAGLGVVLFSAPVLAFAVEFRPDAWAFALFFSALFFLRRQGTGSVGARQYACFAFAAAWAAIACLKVAPFVVMFAALDLIRLARRGPDLRAALIGSVTGVALAAVIAGLVLNWMRIDVNAVYQFAFQFQILFERNTGFSHGLARSLIDNRLPLLVASVGLLSWAAYTIRTRTVPEPFHASIVAVLLWELFYVARPYKQYYGPWLLMAAPFFAYIEACCRLRGWSGRLPLVTALVAGGAVAVASLARLRQNELGPMIRQLQEQIAASSAEGSSVIAPPPFSPIVRRDVFYAWSRTTDPGGYTTERGMSDLGYEELVSAEHYRDELDRSDPALIVLPLPGEELYEALQWQIISEFLRRNAGRYEIVKEGFIRPFAVRRAAIKAGKPRRS